MSVGTVTLPTELQESLRSLSVRTGRSEQDLIVDAVVEYLRREDNSLPQSIGAGSDPDLSAAHVKDWLRDNWRPD